jgi:protein gp37
VTSRTKIDWCDCVWNPVWGCRHSCPYCYARSYARRFGVQKAYQEKKHIESPGWTLELLTSLAGRLQAFESTFLWSNFNKAFPRKASRIFVNSMSDFLFWKPDWKHMTLSKIRRHPEHTFLFLTKNPKTYENLSFQENCWLGVTVTRQAEMDSLEAYLFDCSWEKRANLFLSIEPILEPVKLTITLDWLIAAGRFVKTASTGTSNKAEARRVTEEMLKRGVVASEDNPVLLPYLSDFWNSTYSLARSSSSSGP